ncbi:MFS transporter [Streptomyces ipomoeae]|uniref:Transporter, major facilitator family protein n=2 Tax=Streptomyces ipomoeae TaxID=103232 RepID=L1L947_9ACTN|nr:Cmx/CmrA family chloramphenicol efflux MFS transporter [Streptomyces ipomoeae]EKX69299.1 transporter, major facilitator family protein [Streptomyces ipomoeae 91-03]MDX2698646.1 MFS transporter [Streptomyces ipomoeae]MDX2844295.1 MFS transporter [Streptomyces ipomoeae]TQE21494.1 MFS transporter [Streptomyces ipomoeae]TQE36573.1 MFS transporter [Streptomyces ipomoeae]
MPAHPDRPRPRVPLSVYVLGLSVFALGTSEFMLSGLLPPIAEDMEVSIPRAGLLISAFAIGMVVGAPLLAVATLRLPRRTTLVTLLTVFGLGQVAGAIAPNYAVLFASRVVSALACAGFWAVGAAVAVAMVPVNARARALAIMIGGLSIANVLGVPAGAFLGEHFGWRSAFWAVTVASAVALLGVLTLVPAIPLPDERPRLTHEVRIYREPQLWLSIAVVALTAAGVFCVFSYLAPLLTDVAGLDDGWVPTVLALFGIGALTGTAIGGRFADAHLFGVLLSGIAASTVLLVALALLSQYAVAAVLLSFLLGVSCFYTAPALNARMFNVAGAAPTLAGATTTAAFNLGNTGGPWLGGVVIDAGFGFTSTAWAGGALSAGAIGITAVSLRLHRRTAASRVVAGGDGGEDGIAVGEKWTAAVKPVRDEG